MKKNNTYKNNTYESYPINPLLTFWWYFKGESHFFPRKKNWGRMFYTPEDWHGTSKSPILKRKIIWTKLSWLQAPVVHLPGCIAVFNPVLWSNLQSHSVWVEATAPPGPVRMAGGWWVTSPGYEEPSLDSDIQGLSNATKRWYHAWNFGDIAPNGVFFSMMLGASFETHIYKRYPAVKNPWKSALKLKLQLVGGFNPSEKMWVKMGSSSPSFGVKACQKPSQIPVSQLKQTQTNDPRLHNHYFQKVKLYSCNPKKCWKPTGKKRNNKKYCSSKINWNFI